MRAAFKAVMDGKQVAVLAPTTVLAFQHLKTLKSRFAAFPVRIDMVSRFRTQSGAEGDARGPRRGQGRDHRRHAPPAVEGRRSFATSACSSSTRNSASASAHKEKIKQLRKRVDVLTMTATPIPRTLNMSLAGIRDMSIIETPPKDRLSIQTNVVKFDQAVIARAIRTEMERGGQIYFVHNRVESIYSLGNLITRLVPEARIGRRPRADGRGRARAGDGGFRRPQVRRAARDHNHRERARHSQRQHDDHQPRRSLRALTALPAARPGRTLRPACLCLPADSSRGGAVAGRQEAAGGDPGVQRPGQRLPCRGARPRDPGRRQPARRRAERPHRGGRLRHVHEAARADDQGAQGRGDRGRDPRQRQPAGRPADRRRVHPRHEPAADRLPTVCRRPQRRRARPAHGRGPGPVRRAA